MIRTAVREALKGKKHMFKPEKLILPNNVENGCEPVNLQELFFYRTFFLERRKFYVYIPYPQQELDEQTLL